MLSTLYTAVLLVSLKSHEIGMNVFPLTHRALRRRESMWLAQFTPLGDRGAGIWP